MFASQGTEVLVKWFCVAFLFLGFIFYCSAGKPAAQKSCQRIT